MTNAFNLQENSRKSKGNIMEIRPETLRRLPETSREIVFSKDVVSCLVTLSEGNTILGTWLARLPFDLQLAR